MPGGSTPGSAEGQTADAPERSTAGVQEFTGPAWRQAGNVSLGWIVGAATDAWLGDGTVGLTSHEVCPRHFFIVPRGAEHVRITWTAYNLQPDGPGVGDYTFVISQPEEIHFIEPIVDEGSREWDSPPAGVWELKVQARPLAYNLMLDANVTMGGVGPMEPPLEFYHDGDCIQ